MKLRTVVLRFLGVCVLAFALAFGALFAFTSVLNNEATVHPAAAGCICAPPSRTVDIQWLQVSGIDNVAHAYGDATAGYLFCSANSPGSAFGDCYDLLAYNEYNVYNVITFWAYYGYGTLWGWTFNLNGFEGYSVI